MAVLVCRVLVLWLLLCVMWGVFSLVVATSEGEILPRVLRDIGGTGVWLAPLLAVVVIIAEQFEARLPWRSALPLTGGRALQRM